MKKIKQLSKIKPNPINNSTEHSKYIDESRRWHLSKERNDYLSIAHYLDVLLNEELYLVLNTYFGTINSALLDCGNTVISTDYNEYYYPILPENVKKTFKTIDISSSVLYLGKVDVIILFSDNIPYLDDLLVFIKKHSPKYIVLYTAEDCILPLENIGYTLQTKLLQKLKKDLFNKIENIDINSVFIFENINIKGEDNA